MGRFNCYSATAQYQQVLATIPLGTGLQKITIKAVTTTARPRIDIDRIQPVGICPVIIKSTAPAASTAGYENDSSSITYRYGWSTTVATSLSGGTSHRTKVNGAEASFAFKGTTLKIIGTKGVSYGRMLVYIDGATTPTKTINMNAPTTTYKAALTTITGLTEGVHTARIVTQLDATGKNACIDRIEVTGISPRIAKWYHANPAGGINSTSYTYNTLGQRITATVAAPLASYTYSWKGQRLSSVAISDGNTAAYVYDGFGQRTKKTVSSDESATVTDYIYDGLYLLSLAEKTGSVTRSLTYLYADGATPVGALYQDSATGRNLTFEIAPDRRGDVRELRDMDGIPFARYDYDAFGNIRSDETYETPLIDEDSAQVISNLQPLRYAGYAFDSETQLYYCSQRYYDPTVAAFISKDPIKADGEFNSYTYCMGDPVNLSDPTGLDPYWVKRRASYLRKNPGSHAAANIYGARISYQMNPSPWSATKLADANTAYRVANGGGYGKGYPSLGMSDFCTSCGRHLLDCRQTKDVTMKKELANNTKVLKRDGNTFSIVSTSVTIPLYNGDEERYTLGILSVSWGAGASGSVVSTAMGVGTPGQNERGYTIDILTAGYGPYAYSAQDPSSGKTGIGGALDVPAGPALRVPVGNKSLKADTISVGGYYEHYR